MGQVPLVPLFGRQSADVRDTLYNFQGIQGYIYLINSIVNNTMEGALSPPMIRSSRLVDLCCFDSQDWGAFEYKLENLEM